MKIKLNSLQRKERRKLYHELIGKVKSKRDLLSYNTGDINIGLDIYDTILRTGVPTVDLDSIRSKKIIVLGLSTYLFAKHIFESGKIKGVLLSHDNYVWMGTVARVAYKYGVPVYFGNPYEILKTKRSFHIYERYQFFPKIFSGLSEAEKTDAKLWAKDKLTKRLAGEVGVMMSYQTKSEFGNQLIPRQTKDTKKVKIVVATHCFYDSPNCLGWMLFPDFYEWLFHLG